MLGLELSPQQRLMFPAAAVPAIDERIAALKIVNGRASVVDFGAAARIIPPPIEICGRDRPVLGLAGAEGATAPEPLRQKDRRLMALWKAAGSSRGSPKG